MSDFKVLRVFLRGRTRLDLKQGLRDAGNLLATGVAEAPSFNENRLNFIGEIVGASDRAGTVLEVEMSDPAIASMADDNDDLTYQLLDAHLDHASSYTFEELIDVLGLSGAARRRQEYVESLLCDPSEEP